MKIGITIGDPGGVGPEVALKAITMLKDRGLSWVVFGPRVVKDHPFIQHIGSFSDVHWVDTGVLPSSAYAIGCADAQNGLATEAMLRIANEWAMAGRIDALATAPINKTALSLAGSAYTGHTTMLQALSGASEVSMAFYSPALSIILATIHNRYRDVPALLNSERLRQTIRHAFQYAEMLGLSDPRIAMAGLNPHAGEGGLFGDEEVRLIMPVVTEMTRQGLRVSGPWSPDTVFRRAVDGEFDIVIALYHDQGLIPIKLLAFDSAVNVSVGLPYIRVSPDHGTAYDIAYQNKASADAMVAAIRLAIQLAEGKSGSAIPA